MQAINHAGDLRGLAVYLLADSLRGFGDVPTSKMDLILR